MKFPILGTKNILLNEITQEDIRPIFDIYSNDEVTKYCDLESFEILEQSAILIKLVQVRFKESVGIRWAIRLRGSDTCIGTCGFNSWNEKYQSTVIGYDLNNNYWRRGIMTQALTSIVSFAFNGGLACSLINRIQADIAPDNSASEKVLKKIGFQEEGLMKQNTYQNISFRDLNCFSLWKKDFFRQQM